MCNAALRQLLESSADQVASPDSTSISRSPSRQAREVNGLSVRCLQSNRSLFFSTLSLRICCSCVRSAAEFVIGLIGLTLHVGMYGAQLKWLYLDKTLEMLAIKS